jgi:hypothetical protein
VQEIEKVIALFEKVDLEHNGKVNKGSPSPCLPALSLVCPF